MTPREELPAPELQLDFLHLDSRNGAPRCPQEPRELLLVAEATENANESAFRPNKKGQQTNAKPPQIKALFRRPPPPLVLRAAPGRAPESFPHRAGSTRQVPESKTR